MPSFASARRASRGQVIVGLAIASGLCLTIVAGGPHGRLVLGGLAAVLLASVVLARLIAVTVGLLTTARHPIETEIPDNALPRYSVLVPLYREAAILGHLITAMHALDYPRAQLEVLLLVEDDDIETRNGLAACVLPCWMRVVLIPPGTPRTKPRACNHGLLQATGELLVVFDAEDRPEPNQLRRAAAVFARSSAEVACLQARLHIDNTGASLWSRWFACEYLLWFDAYLPGLHACGAPIPLGGTSNHFRLPVIRDLGWDPWNVAEDCDLGMRLARSGRQTTMLDSTTWEEAPHQFGPWLRQRSRWTKGWLQTLLVHTREPLTAVREFGWRKYAWFLLIVGGQLGGLLAAPLGLLLAGVWIWQPWPLWDPAQPWTVILLASAMGLVLASPLLVLAHQLTLIGCRSWRLLPCTFGLPLYWLLMGIAAWRGTLQLLTAPFLWEKTPHGSDGFPIAVQASACTPPVVDPLPVKGAPHVTEILRARPVRRPLRAMLAVVLLVACCGSLATAWRTLTWSGAWDAIKLAQLPFSGPPAHEQELIIEANWIGAEKIEFTFEKPLASSGDGLALRATVWLTVVDGEWFQQALTIVMPPGTTQISAPLDGPWKPVAHGSPWSPQLLMRVRTAGIRILTAEGDRSAALKVAHVTASGQAAVVPQAVTELRQLEAARCQEPTEFRCSLAQPIKEPFDPEKAQVFGVISGAGTNIRIPGFLTRDFTRSMIAGAELLSALGPPEWAVRWTPTTPGTYSLTITCTTPDGTTATSTPRQFSVTASDLPGPVSINGKWFRRDGNWFYPQGINLRSPHDDLVDQLGIPQPAAAAGSIAMEDSIAKLNGSGWNLLRVWLSPTFGALEWDRRWAGHQGLGAYSLQEAWKIDRVFQAARRSRMVVDLALWQHGPFSPDVDSQWEHNPYNRALGGPLTDPADILTNTAARQYQQRMLRYATARWGSDPALFAWTLWIEVDGVGRSGLVDWHREVARTLRQHDPGKHPISTLFRSSTGDPAVWALPEIDYTQVAAYNTRELATVVSQRAASLEVFEKPALIEELGGHSQGGSPTWLAHEIHDGPWLAWVLPFSGSPWPWWWNVVLHHDLGRHQQRFSEFIKGEDLSHRTWRFLRGPLRNDPKLEVLARVDDDGGHAWIHRPLHLENAQGNWDQNYATLTRGFSALSQDPGQLFDPLPGRTLNLERFGLDPNRAWEVELWDTWSTGEPKRFSMGADKGMAVPLDTLVRDAALRIRPMERQTMKATLPSSLPTVQASRRTYHVVSLPAAPPAGSPFTVAPWADVTPLRLENFHIDSSNHRPSVEVKIATSPNHLHLCWEIKDQFVRSVETTMNGYVSKDSCVEFFFAPPESLGYFNLEINAGGIAHCSFIEDPRIVNGTFARRRMLNLDDLRQITIHSTLPPVIDPEIATPVTWELTTDIPLEVLRRYAGPALLLQGPWRANFYKCADQTSHPHWASWASTGAKKWFHQPELFGTLMLPLKP